MAGVVVRIVAGLTGLAVVLAGVLFLLAALSRGEKVYLACTSSDASSEPFGLIYERLPAWVFWANSDGYMWLDGYDLLLFFPNVTDSLDHLRFSDAVDGGDFERRGTLSKSALEVEVRFSNGATIDGICDPASFAVRW